MMWSYYWGCFQRFFKHMTISAKVGVFPWDEFQIHECVELTNSAINEGKCVVIGLQSTGDSRTKSEVLRQCDQSTDSEDENDGKSNLCYSC